ncbi:MAG: alpha-ketoglutarate-dependent dioxygenase AlkB, partial [Pseudomonadota bacterium]
LIPVRAISKRTGVEVIMSGGADMSCLKEAVGKEAEGYVSEQKELVASVSEVTAVVPMLLQSGDAIVLAGRSRCYYHGVDGIQSGSSGVVPDGGRINITIRRVWLREGPTVEE